MINIHVKTHVPDSWYRPSNGLIREAGIVYVGGVRSRCPSGVQLMSSFAGKVVKNNIP
jgi:hypothetical protein